MLNSLINNRRKVQKKITSIATSAQGRRAQCPPSPSSFVSAGNSIPDINEKLLGNASLPDLALGYPNTTPRVQLDLNYRTSTISDWFPSDFLRGEPVSVPSLPARNVSLPGNGPPAASESIYAPHSVDGHAEGVSVRGNELELDDVLVIGAQQPEPTLSTPLISEQGPEGDDAEPEDAMEGADSSRRKPTPTPIKIPNNTAGSKIKIQRSASATSAGPHTRLPIAGSTEPSRPPSPGSAYTEMLSSAVSGTTLARALVDSFIATSDSRASRYRALTRQDSTTLPRGENPWLRRYGADMLSPEDSSIPPVPPLPSADILSAGLPSSALLGNPPLAIVTSGTSPTGSRRNSLAADRHHASMELPHNHEVASAAKRLSVSRGARDSLAAPPPISPISEGSSPAPSVPPTPLFLDGSNGVSNVSLKQSPHRRSAQSGNVTASDDDGVVSKRSSNSEQPERGSDASAPIAIERITKRNSRLPTLNLTRSYSESETVTTGSAYSSSSFERPGSSSTSGTSFKSSDGSSKNLRTRSESGSERPPRITPAHIPLLPIGERPHSAQVPYSPSSPLEGERTRLYHGQTVPITARLSSEVPFDSPDLLDFMFPVSNSHPHGHGRFSREQRGTSDGLPSLSIAPEDLSSPLRSPSAESLSSPAEAHQTFPETPYAFSPMWSPLPPPPTTPGQARPLPRAASFSRIAVDRRRIVQQQRIRSTSVSAVASPTPTGTAHEGDKERPAPITIARLSSIEESLTSPMSHASSPAPLSAPQEITPPTAPPASVRAPLPRPPLPALPAIIQPQEASVASPPPVRSAYSSASEGSLGSPPPSYAAAPEPPLIDALAVSTSPEQLASGSAPRSPRVQDSSDPVVSTTRPHSPLPTPSPPPADVSSVPMPISPAPPREDEPPVHEQPPPPYMEEARRPAVSMPTTPPRVSPPAAPTTRQNSVPEMLGNKRLLRTRPPLPAGPRKPSFPSMALARDERSRNDSVSSLRSVSGARPSTRALGGTAPAPRFQTRPVEFKGMTMEAAQWTFTSQELQDIVSSAIRRSSDATTIRLLSRAQYDGALPAELARLQEQSAELRTSYKLGVRKRRTLLAMLTAQADSADGHDTPAALRNLEELADITDSLDQLAEEIYSVADQITQLTHIYDVHSGSALAMALRKLHSKVLKQFTETARLQDQLAGLEAEREDAWKQAHEIAQEFDEFADRSLPPSEQLKDSASRRSSRVIVARRNSTRVTKAGLRTSMYRRSHRSSSSSARNSISSPAMRLAGPSNVPPVPPMPSREALGIVTDLPTSSSGMLTESPSFETSAMVQAQNELCEMLGISPEDIKGSLPRRRQSWSAVLDLKVVSESQSPSTMTIPRRASDILSVASRTPGTAQLAFRLDSPL